MPELTREIRNKRVAVAKDILVQLDREDVPLMPSRLTYLESNKRSPIEFDAPLEGDLQPHVDLLQRHCECCLIGAAFLSMIRLYDNCPATVVDATFLEDGFLWVDERDMKRALLAIFSKRELGLMEVMFEVWGQGSADEDRRRAGTYGRRFDSAHDALRGIAQILIDNDGEFVIPAEQDGGEVPLPLRMAEAPIGEEAGDV
jgi:hypothetical protein